MFLDKIREFVEGVLLLTIQLVQSKNRRQTWFDTQIEGEIYGKIFPHLQCEEERGYSFAGSKELESETERLNIKPLLLQVEDHISKMPRAYSKAFRYIMHRDLQKTIRHYENLARRRIHRECNPRFVATRLETSSN